MNEKRKRIFQIIQIGQRGDFASRFFDYFILTVILLNITALFLETFNLPVAAMIIVRVVEWVTVLIFLVEYILRIWTADLLYPKVSKRKAGLKFLVSYTGIVELFTILPFFFLSGFAVFRMLRVVRILHLFRINNSYDSFNVITGVLYEKKNQIISSLFIITILVLSASLCMYSAEHEAQPDVFENAFSGIWWSVSTVFTVGYGDIYPVTLLGRFMGAIITVLGVGAVAIPTGIISAGFVEHYQKAQIGNRNIKPFIYNITKESVYYEKTIKSLEEKNMDVLGVIREGKYIMPEDEIVLKENDTLIYIEI